MRPVERQRSGAPWRIVRLVLAVVIGSTLALGAAAPANAYDEGTIVALANDARASNGLGGLVRNSSLDAVALGWAQQLAASGTLGHNPSVGSQIPGGWSAWGENVAQGYASGAAVHAGWMGSSGHRANILGGFTDIGVALIEGGGTTWAVQVFATYAGSGLPAPAPAAPAPAPAAPAPAPVPAAPAPAPAAPAAPAAPEPSAAPAGTATPAPSASSDAAAGSDAEADDRSDRADRADDAVDATTLAADASAATAGGLPGWTAPLIVLLVGLVGAGALLILGWRRRRREQATGS